MEEFTKKMRYLISDNNIVRNISALTYTDFDGHTSTGVNSIVEMGADLGTLNPNEE